jgi:hypothetical protein
MAWFGSSHHTIIIEVGEREVAVPRLWVLDFSGMRINARGRLGLADVDDPCQCLVVEKNVGDITFYTVVKIHLERQFAIFANQLLCFEILEMFHSPPSILLEIIHVHRRFQEGFFFLVFSFLVQPRQQKLRPILVRHGAKRSDGILSGGSLMCFFF